MRHHRPGRLGAHRRRSAPSSAKSGFPLADPPFARRQHGVARYGRTCDYALATATAVVQTPLPRRSRLAWFGFSAYSNSMGCTPGRGASYVAGAVSVPPSRSSGRALRPARRGSRLPCSTIRTADSFPCPSAPVAYAAARSRPAGLLSPVAALAAGSCCVVHPPPRTRPAFWSALARGRAAAPPRVGTPSTGPAPLRRFRRGAMILLGWSPRPSLPQRRTRAASVTSMPTAPSRRAHAHRPRVHDESPTPHHRPGRPCPGAERVADSPRGPRRERRWTPDARALAHLHSRTVRSCATARTGDAVAVPIAGDLARSWRESSRPGSSADRGRRGPAALEPQVQHAVVPLVRVLPKCWPCRARPPSFALQPLAHGNPAR